MTKLARKWSLDIPLQPNMVCLGWLHHRSHNIPKMANSDSLELSDLTVHGVYFEPMVGIHFLTCKVVSSSFPLYRQHPQWSHRPRPNPWAKWAPLPLLLLILVLYSLHEQWAWIIIHGHFSCSELWVGLVLAQPKWLDRAWPRTKK